MKRREFVTLASVGAASALIAPFAARAASSSPCPPPTVSIQGGQSVSTSCVAAAPGSAPQWFVKMADATWGTIAASGTIAKVLPNPVPHVAGGPDQPASIMSAWTGGGVDQNRGEFILAGNGGHADYPGNEAYALSVRDENPAWRRLADPTPNDQLGDTNTTGNGSYNDGRPRAMHSTFECYGDGRVWFPLQNSVTSNDGGTVNRVVAFNRDMLGSASSPLPWSASSLGPWEIYGAPFAAGQYLGGVIFGVSAFDRIGHKVWALGGNGANYSVYWSVDTAGSTLGKITKYQANQPFGNWGTWVVVATDLRILVAGDHLRQVITVLDLTNPTNITQVSNVTGTGFFTQGGGGAYIPANKTIAVGNAQGAGTAIRKLKIPTKISGGQTVYDPNGQWQWNSISASSAVTMSIPAGNSDSYTKWNVIEDMGNGQSAIVVATDINGPVYVYKVPLAGL
jgi:hypothetical protein